MSIDTHIHALYQEGKALQIRSDLASWRLAEIINELRSENLTFQEIADEFGWTHRNTAERYVSALAHRDVHPRFADAYLFGNMSDDRATAVNAVAEADGISPHTAKSRPNVKEIAAAISDLPVDEKHQVAKELAMDKSFARDVLKEADRFIEQELDDRRNTVRREKGPVAPVTTALDGAEVFSLLDVVMLELGRLAKATSEHTFNDEERALYGQSLAAVQAMVEGLAPLVDAKEWDMKELAHEEG